MVSHALQCGEPAFRSWLAKWGYGPDLFSRSARCFVLSVHSEKDGVVVTSEESASPELDYWAGLIEMQHFGELRTNNRTVAIYQMSAR